MTMGMEEMYKERLHTWYCCGSTGCCTDEIPWQGWTTSDTSLPFLGSCFRCRTHLSAPAMASPSRFQGIQNPARRVSSQTRLHSTSAATQHKTLANSAYTTFLITAAIALPLSFAYTPIDASTSIDDQLLGYVWMAKKKKNFHSKIKIKLFFIYKIKTCFGWMKVGELCSLGFHGPSKRRKMKFNSLLSRIFSKYFFL